MPSNKIIIFKKEKNMRYEIRYINYGYGIITYDAQETMEEVKKVIDECKKVEFMGDIEVDVVSVFDNYLEEYVL